jgi:DNA-binding NtrC family response regulator
MGVSGTVNELIFQGGEDETCATTLPRVLILEEDPVHRRVMRRLLGLMGCEVSSTAKVGEARRVLRDQPVSLVVVGCHGSDDLDDLLKTLSLPEHVHLVVVSSRAVSSSRRVFTFIRRPCSWSALRKAIEQNVLFAV